MWRQLVCTIAHQKKTSRLLLCIREDVKYKYCTNTAICYRSRLDSCVANRIWKINYTLYCLCIVLFYMWQLSITIIRTFSLERITRKAKCVSVASSCVTETERYWLCNWNRTQVQKQLFLIKHYEPRIPKSG